MRPDLVRGNLNLLVLAVLARRPAHGYAVIEALRERSGGQLDLPEGTVYPALHRLEAAGHLASEESVVDGRRRRTYAVTRDGLAVIDARKDEWRRFARVVELVTGGTA